MRPPWFHLKSNFEDYPIAPVNKEVCTNAILRVVARQKIINYQVEQIKQFLTSAFLTHDLLQDPQIKY